MDTSRPYFGREGSRVIPGQIFDQIYGFMWLEETSLLDERQLGIPRLGGRLIFTLDVWNKVRQALAFTASRDDAKGSKISIAVSKWFAEPENEGFILKTLEDFEKEIEQVLRNR